MVRDGGLGKQFRSGQRGCRKSQRHGSQKVASIHLRNSKGGSGKGARWRAVMVRPQRLKPNNSIAATAGLEGLPHPAETREFGRQKQIELNKAVSNPNLTHAH